MYSQYFHIAKSKTNDPIEAEALDRIAEIAHEYDLFQQSFTEKINDNKAKRGEFPTKLSKATRESMESFETDRVNAQARIAKQLEAMSSPQSIVRSLNMGFSRTLPNAQNTLKHFHPDDLSIGEEKVKLIARFVTAMESYLEQYQGSKV